MADGRDYRHHRERKTMDTKTSTTPDWDRIRVEFEAGILPIRGIARREGVSDTSINKKAKSNGWDGSLRKPARPANPMLPGLQTEVQTDRAEVEQTVERARNTFPIDPDDDGFRWIPENEDSPKAERWRSISTAGACLLDSLGHKPRNVERVSIDRSGPPPNAGAGPRSAPPNLPGSNRLPISVPEKMQF
jgi:hypothetical protein